MLGLKLFQIHPSAKPTQKQFSQFLSFPNSKLRDNPLFRPLEETGNLIYKRFFPVMGQRISSDFA